MTRPFCGYLGSKECSSAHQDHATLQERAGKRVPALRKMSSSISDDDISNAAQVMTERTNQMGSRANDRAPFTDEELRDVINSLHNITPHNADIDWDALERLIVDIAHLSHKDWHATGNNSDRMADILLPEGKGLDVHACQMFERILHEGNWDGALEHAKSREKGNNKPWAVLVTGVNGIRKTTSIYQPWFTKVLGEALIAPPSPLGGEEYGKEFDMDALPDGSNSFFRQLDHMITTLCNENFANLYALTAAQLGNVEKEEAEQPPKELVKQYSNLKASIFSRYRTLSELLGALLLKEAQKLNLNTMCETSGRDIAMFQYIDHFFSNCQYNKLALHFEINDLECAMQSVDARMAREMLTGKEALESGDVVEVIYANAGGPYGSEVLKGVEADSNRVWSKVMSGEGGVGADWFKASIRINAHVDKPWTIQALRPNGTLGTEHTFEEMKVEHFKPRVY